MLNKQENTVAHTPGNIQEVLEAQNFLRVRRQYLVNLNHLKKYVCCEGNHLIVANDANIPVAGNQKERWWKSLVGGKIKK